MFQGVSLKGTKLFKSEGRGKGFGAAGVVLITNPPFLHEQCGSVYNLKTIRCFLIVKLRSKNNDKIVKSFKEPLGNCFIGD